jgi:hypothetical protein
MRVQAAMAKNLQARRKRGRRYRSYVETQLWAAPVVGDQRKVVSESCLRH